MIRLIFLCFFVSINCYAQDLKFVRYSSSDGLPSNEIYSILQDKNGILWVATDRGLSWFDGKSFRTLPPPNSDKNFVVLKLKKNPAGTVFCVTMDNQFYEIRNTEKLVSYKYNDSIKKYIEKGFLINDFSFKNNELSATFLLASGYLKISEIGKVVQTPYRQSKLTTFQISTAKNENLFIRKGIEEDSSHSSENQFYFSQPQQIGGRFWGAQLNKQTEVVILDNEFIVKKDNSFFKSHKLSPNSTALSYGTYKSTNFWIATLNEGLKVFNDDGELLHTHFDGESITCYYEDHEGGQWFSTLSKGLYYCPNKNLYHYHLNSHPIDIEITNPDECYVSTHDGGVYRVYNNHVATIELADFHQNTYLGHTIPENHLLAGNLKFREYANGHWINQCKSNKLIVGFADYANKLPLFYTRSNVYESKNGVLDELLESSYRIHDVAYIDKVYYIATNSGLFQYKDKKLIPFKKILFDGIRVNDIGVLGDQLLVATHGKGLFVIDKNTHAQFTTKEGLLSDICTKVAGDRNSIWVGTSHGLSVLQFEGNVLSVTSLDEKRGYPVSEITEIKIERSQVWVGCQEGLFLIKKRPLLQNTANFEKFLRIQKVTVNGVTMKPSKTLDLGPDQNQLRIALSAIGFKNQGKFNFRYRFSEDKNWTYTTNNFVEKILPSGQYAFEVQVQLEDNTFGESQTILLNIKVPFWKHGWVITLIFILSLTLLYFGARWIRGLMLKIGSQYASIDQQEPEVRIHYVIVTTNGRDVKVDTRDILYFNSSGNYCEIMTRSNGKLMTRKKTSVFYQEIEDQECFIQVHRSYFVRIDQITAKSSKSLWIEDHEIPVSKTYRENVNELTLK